MLANLNAAFAFGYDRLVIWRDFDALPGDADLEAVLEELGVRWVVLPDELEYIYARRPVWNGLYGNPRRYPELIDLLDGRGTETDRGVFPAYAMRIVPYMDCGAWSIGVYRLNE